MKEQFLREAWLFGEENVQKLISARVAVFGVGGVGGYALEALARSGIGTLDIFDHDTVSESNINRQILATHQSVGRLKAEVAKERVLDINPDAKVQIHPVFFLPENAADFDFGVYDYVVDAIDTVSGKIAIIEQAKKCNVPVISCMGTGNKTDATAFLVDDIAKTQVCPLAKVMRKELKKRGIENVKVVYSKEEPRKSEGERLPASNAYVPPVAGMILAGEVVKDLMEIL